MTTYRTVEQILAAQQRTAEADAKAASDRTSLTAEDLKYLSEDALGDVMKSGLPHLGIGAPRQTRRYR
jgi:hypothetical protein